MKHLFHDCPTAWNKNSTAWNKNFVAVYMGEKGTKIFKNLTQMAAREKDLCLIFGDFCPFLTHVNRHEILVPRRGIFVPGRGTIVEQMFHA